MGLVRTSSYPLPGVLRLRALQPLSDRDGSCSLIYDLERAAVLEVPEDLQFHIAPALETGDLDEDLVSWLVSEDLLTSEGWDADAELAGLSRRDGRSELASLLRLEDEFHGFIDQLEEKAAAEALDFAFKSSLGASRITLHLDWDGAVPDASLVEGLLIESCRRAALSGQEISYELALEPSQVMPALVSRLSGYPVSVRLRCGRAGLAGGDAELSPWLPAEGAARLLLEALGSQVIVQCTLEPQDRLADLWTWAKRIGVQHLDAILAEESTVAGKAGRRPLLYQIRELRGDLLAICHEMTADLSTGQRPIDFEPLTRTVRRLIRHEACGGAVGMAGLSFERSASSLGSLPETSGYSAFLTPSPIEVEAEPSALACPSCWARYACSHSAFVSSPISAEDPREPAEERCASWRAEVEAALHLYHALAHIDPMAVLALFSGDEPTGSPTDRSGWVMPVWTSKPS